MPYAPCTMRFGFAALVPGKEKRQAGFFNPEEEGDNSNRKMRNIFSFWSFGF
jgi:hypothetical protein